MAGSLVTYYPGNTIFHRLDPRAKIVFMFAVSIVIFGVQNLPLSIVIFVTMCVLWVVAKLPTKILFGFLKALLPVFIFLLIVQAILYPGDTILIKPLIPRFIPLIGGAGRITLQGILFALLLMFRLLAMVILLPLVSMTTPVQTMALGITRLGFSYQLAYTITAALNMVPILQNELSSIVDAQKLRAMQSFEKGKLRDKFKAYPALVTPLVIGAMRRAQAMSVAMDSRAFGASRSRTYIQDIQLHAYDWIFMASSLLYAAGLIAINLLQK